MTEAGGNPNIRFIVSNIWNSTPQGLYETTYCGRGKDELYIREFKEAVNGDRLSCHSFNANRLRIFLHAAAYILMHSIREHGLKGTAIEKSTLLEIREKVLLTAVSIRVLKKASCLIMESITLWTGNFGTCFIFMRDPHRKTF